MQRCQQAPCPLNSYVDTVKRLRLLPFAATARHMGSWQSLVWINVATLMGTVLPAPQELHELDLCRMKHIGACA